MRELHESLTDTKSDGWGTGVGIGNAATFIITSLLTIWSNYLITRHLYPGPIHCCHALAFVSMLSPKRSPESNAYIHTLRSLYCCSASTPVSKSSLRYYWIDEEVLFGMYLKDSSCAFMCILAAFIPPLAFRTATVVS